MLTATDVHLLVGFLTAASTPEAVEIELGSMIYDGAAEKERDVDVTAVMRRGDGVAEAFAGIEVKNEARSLDVIPVEQLSAKLLDMSDLTRRAIVSSSGYTVPAVRKATKRGVELWHLRPWPGAGSSDQTNRFRQVQYLWRRGPSLLFNPNDPVDQCAADRFQRHMPPETVQRVLKAVEQAIIAAPSSNELQAGVPMPVNFRCTLTPPVHAQLTGIDSIELRQVRISGVLEKVETTRPVEMRALVQEGHQDPYAACILAELAEGHLVGVFVGQRSVNLVPIAVSMRNQQVLRRLRVR